MSKPFIVRNVGNSILLSVNARALLVRSKQLFPLIKGETQLLLKEKYSK